MTQPELAAFVHYSLRDSDWMTALNVAIIVVVAWIAQRFARRAIKHTVRGMQGEAVQRGLKLVRRRAPSILLSTGQHTTLRSAQRAETIGAILRSASTVIVTVLALFLVLGQLSVHLGPLATGAGVATAALAFGAQNIVRDYLAGLFIVVEDQYGVGDFIDAGEATGLVESVTLRTTRLRSLDGTLWHVPNGEIKRVGNKSQQWARALIEFRVVLDTDLSKAMRIIKQEADSLWHDHAYAGIILEEPEIWGPEDLTTDGMLLTLAVKTRPLEQWQIARTLRAHVKLALDAANIGITGAMSD